MTEVRKVLLLCLVSILCLTSLAEAESEAEVYRKAVQAAKAGKVDFAFMYYNSLIEDHPQSPHREEALFARGEYSFQMHVYAQAQEALNAFLKDYPQSDGRLFALAYLYTIAESGDETSVVEDLKKEIVAFKQVGLVFKEFKEHKYRSPLYQNYKAVFHIDKVEFYREGELFARVSH